MSGSTIWAICLFGAMALFLWTVVSYSLGESHGEQKAEQWAIAAGVATYVWTDLKDDDGESMGGCFVCRYRCQACEAAKDVKEKT